MDYKQHLYYSLGIMAYAVARADGKIQHEEKKALMEMVEQESGHEMDVDYAEIIFQLLQKDQPGMDSIYEWALDALEMGENHLTPEMRDEFVTTLDKVAEAFPPTTDEEKKVIEDFKKELDKRI